MNLCAQIFDLLRDFWRRPEVSRKVSLFLIFSFLTAAAGITLNKHGLLPAPLDTILPVNPFEAIRMAFSLVLAVEVIALIIAISDSVSLAVGKQLEIMGLLLLRETFTDISLLDARINPAEDYLLLLQIASTAVGGLLLFIMRGAFARFRYLQWNKDVASYINAKKCVALALFFFYLFAGAYDLYGVFLLGVEPEFFRIFYTSLIFADILLLLGGQYYMPCFHATFRNSGYAVGTLLMRLSFGVPHYLGAALCVSAGAYILALTWVASRFSPEVLDESGQEAPAAKREAGRARRGLPVLKRLLPETIVSA
ncbi:MAG: hypothetical protein LBP61_01460 [Desulfovibrio sp.]|jgi:hypothetical protein|nr:hypothetical protein [Desulfovibrio sp.]